MTLTTKCHVATICFATIEDRNRIGALKGNHISHVECLKAWLARCAGYPLYQRTDFAKPLYDDHVDNTLQDKDGEETATNYSTCLHVFSIPDHIPIWKEHEPRQSARVLAPAKLEWERTFQQIHCLQRQQSSWLRPGLWHIQLTMCSMQTGILAEVSNKVAVLVRSKFSLWAANLLIIDYLYFILLRVVSIRFWIRVHWEYCIMRNSVCSMQAKT